ncbi:hypothetical protein E1B28_000588 [Marasmius oreades]|uniref:Uncharacterized protein n=1 Tax=Marasmius oreades TaxID=181124 RepID=A0A9P7V1R5_9AGAR|nr:uncharacterized protein E1B28_000588 [Marasmius oreades]KAG7098674.1 hypothetical protein E1B28_000588 [Marasmius oreades]
MWPWGSQTTTSSSPTVAAPAPAPEETKVSYFERVVAEEERNLRLVHPTPEETPSCLNLFDTYLSCNSMRSQIKSYYRSGEGTRCSQKLEDWKFCMGLKWLEPEERREQWIRRRAEWWARRRVEGKCSEDVWEIRREPLENYPRVLRLEEIEQRGMF